MQALQPSGMETPPAGPESKQWNLHSFLVLHLLGQELLDLPHLLGLLCFLKFSYESLYFCFHGIHQIHDLPFHVLHLVPSTKIWNSLSTKPSEKAGMRRKMIIHVNARGQTVKRLSLPRKWDFHSNTKITSTDFKLEQLTKCKAHRIPDWMGAS